MSHQELQVSATPRHFPAEAIQLTGHKSDVLCGKFSKTGELFATAGNDKTVNIWETYSSNPFKNNISCYENAHSNAILDLSWGNDNALLCTCSADSIINIYDIYSGKISQKLKKTHGNNYIYSIDMFNNTNICSVGEDRTWIINDTRDKNKLSVYQHKYQLTTCKYSKDGNYIYIAGIDNMIYKYNLKANNIESNYTLIGHTDTITGISVSNNGNFLLSNSMDNSLIIWDIRNYVKSKDRIVKILKGNVHNFEKNLWRCAWSDSDMFVSAGSADRCVNIWDAYSGEIVKKWYGHNGCVNDVDFSGELIGSVSSDKTAIIGIYN